MKAKVLTGGWIEIDFNNLPQEGVIFEFKHPEYGTIVGSIVKYGGRYGSEQSYWVYPEPEPVSQADIWLNEFTHYRRLEPVAPISENPKTPENRGIKSEDKFNSNMQLRLNIWVNGQRGNTFPVDICNAGYNMCLEDVVKVIEEEIGNITSALNGCRISSSKKTYRYAIKALTDLLTKLKTQPK